jgi:hypothetical protein
MPGLSSADADPKVRAIAKMASRFFIDMFIAITPWAFPSVILGKKHAVQRWHRCVLRPNGRVIQRRSARLLYLMHNL